MSARFRIRTSSGQEMEFASLEVFSEFVRLGDLAPDDVVYDAETKEWSSALTHPVVLQIQLDAEEAALAPAPQPLEAGPESATPSADTPAQEPISIGEIGLDLAPAQSRLTPEQEAAAFVAKMAAERASDLEAPLEQSIQGFTMEQPGLGSQVPEPPPPPPRRVEPRPSPLERDPPHRGPVRKESARAEPLRPSKEKRASGVSRYAPFIIVVLALGGVAVYFGPELLRSEAGNGDQPTLDTPPVSDEPPPEIADNEESVRRRAEERFLSATQSALRGLDPIPEVWLRGQYLAAPSDFPNVRTVWEAYLSTIREVRSGDDQRYEAAYVRALDDARVDGAARTLRLASALTDFRAAAPARMRHYDRVEALATAALTGHDALVRAEGTIQYEPASGPRVSNDPVIEATGRGAQAQALLEQVLDQILAQLQGNGGPQEASRVRDWVWTGLLDAVANPRGA